MKSLIRRLWLPFSIELKKIEQLNALTGSKAAQLSLFLHYRSIAQNNQPLPKISDVGYRVYSQNDEDGIILFIFAILGTTNKIFVEIGTGNATECNCANLAINFGWHGLFIDGDEEAIANGIEIYKNHPDTRVYPPKFISAMVTRDNINQIITDAGFQGEIDSLSIDIDGIDYWVLDCISGVSPRVIVVVANAKFGMISITVPYDPHFVYDSVNSPHYHGASLPAFTKLLNKKGYRLVGTNRFGFNAFYVRNDIGKELLPAVTIESCRTHPTRENDEKIFDKISHLLYVEV